MSCLNGGTYVDCVAIQEAIEGNFGELSGNFRENVAFTEVVLSGANRAGVLKNQIDRGNGHIKQVEVVYMQRGTTDEVGDSADLACKTGNQLCETSHVYDIDTSVGSDIKWSIKLRDIERRCEDDSFFVARALMNRMDTLVRRINEKNLAEAVLLKGKFATTHATTPINLATKNNAGVFVPDAIQRIRFEYRKMKYSGTPFVFGSSFDFETYFESQNYACCNTTFGLDLGKLLSLQKVVPFFDDYTETAFGAGNILAFAPGAIQMITFNEFKGDNGSIRVINQDTEKQGTIIDPLSGIEFDYHAQYDCGTWWFQLKVAHELVALPNDIFNNSPAEPLRGVNWITEFSINNPELCACPA